MKPEPLNEAFKLKASAKIIDEVFQEFADKNNMWGFDRSAIETNRDVVNLLKRTIQKCNERQKSAVEFLKEQFNYIYWTQFDYQKCVVLEGKAHKKIDEAFEDIK